MYAPGRGRTSASPRGSVHLASVGLAQGAPKRLASGSDGEETRRETSRTHRDAATGLDAMNDLAVVADNFRYNPHLLRTTISEFLVYRGQQPWQ